MGVVAEQTYLERYLSGEYEPVWADLVALGKRVRDEPLAADAWAVACETMQRVRRNVEALIPRLSALGYRFGDGLFPFAPIDAEALPGPPLLPPAWDAAERIAALEGLVGPLPLSVRAFYQIVGAVNLVGWHPDWPNEYSPDPLYIYPLHVQLDMCGDWRRRDCFAPAHAEWAANPVLLTVAPDYDVKYGVEGDVYEMQVPNSGIDGLLLGERHSTTFVNYLRICCRWAGLPGLDRLPDASPWASKLSALSRELQPL
jgi:hypothetical protein